MKKMITAIALSMIAGAAMAVEPVVVQTATKLDVKEVVSVEPADADFTDVCGVVEQTITYFDSKGVLSKTTYKRQGTGCNG